MSLFGSSSTTSTPLFGTANTASKPLFGASPATAAAAPKPGGLFGATATTTSSVPLFGSSTTAPTTTTAGSLFGNTTFAAPATGGLFGANATSTSGGLLGATSTSTVAGSLFGSKPATTTAPTLGGGLFGATPAVTTTSTFGTAATTVATPSLGLGGVQQDKSVTNASGSVTNSLSGGDKDTTKEAELQAANFIREMLPLIEDKLKKNRDLMEEVENISVDSVPIDDMIDKTRGWISEVRRNVRNATEASTNVAQLASHDKALLETAKRVQDQAATANQTNHANFIKKHLEERTNIYDLEMQGLQNRVNELRNRFEKLLRGEPSLTMEELDSYFHRCDATVSSAQYSIQEVGREIEELKNQLIEQGYTHLRKTYPVYSSNANSLSMNEGAEFFPSQSSLAVIGSSLRAPAAAPAVGGLGLTTGTSLFGSNTGGSSLFGSSTAAKPAFSGGSLFGNLTSTAPATTTANTTSSTSLFGAKPNTTFASTVSNNSSGLLFSSKK